MAKPQTVVHVQSSAFKDLLNTQVEALDTLKSMKEIMDAAQKLKVDATGGDDAQAKKTIEENLKTTREMVAQRKLEVQKIKEKLKLQDEEAEAIANIAKSIKTFKTVGEKLEDFGKKLKDNLSFSGIKTNLLKTFNIGGIFNKAIERQKFVKAQKAMGSEKSAAELKQDFEGAYKTSKGLKKTDKEIEDFKKLTGLSESEMAKTKGGRKLLDQRKSQAEEYSKYDIRAGLVRQSDGGETPSQKFADKGAQEEAAIEQNKMIDSQTELLTKIEENTRGASPDQKAKPQEGEQKGGLLGKLMGGGGAGKALSALKDFGVGIVLVAGALWVASKAFDSFAEVEWESIGKGLVVLGGLVLAGKALAKVQGDLIKGALGIGALALAMWGVSAAMGEFKGIEDVIVPATAAIGGLAIIGALVGKSAGQILLGSVALGALGAAAWVIGKGFQELGEAFNSFIDGIERLSKVGFEGLAGVAGGLLLLGPAMAAFGVGAAAAGMGNLVSGFLSSVSGQKSPVDQLIEIGKAGEGVSKAGTGMQALGSAMKTFSEIKPESLKAIKEFPWEEATKFVAAGGAMSANGAQIYNQSKSNADAGAEVGSGGGGNTNVVNAPVNNVTRHTNVISASVRNQESSQTRYINSKYAVA